MDEKEAKELLQSIKLSDYDIQLYFISKDSETNDYESIRVKIDDLIEHIKKLIYNAIMIIEKNGIDEFSISTNKNVVDWLNRKTDGISESLTKIIDSFESPLAEIVNNTFNGYCIVGYRNNYAELMFITKQNPQANAKRAFSIFHDNKLKAIDKPLYALSLAPDCLVYKDDVFFINEKAENYLGIDTYNSRTFKNNIPLLENIKFIKNADDIIKFYDKPIYRKLLSDLANKNRIDELNNLSSEDLEHELSLYELETDTENKCVILKTGKDYKIFANIICDNYLIKDDGLYLAKGMKLVKPFRVR